MLFSKPHARLFIYLPRIQLLRNTLRIPSFLPLSRPLAHNSLVYLSGVPTAPTLSRRYISYLSTWFSRWVSSFLYSVIIRGTWANRSGMLACLTIVLVLSHCSWIGCLIIWSMVRIVILVCSFSPWWHRSQFLFIMLFFKIIMDGEPIGTFLRWN